MNKYTPQQIIQQLSAVIDNSLAKATVESYVEMQQRFLIGDWAPSQLNGGRLCEAVARSLFYLDTGKVNHKKLPGEICDYLVDQKQPHTLTTKDRHHIAKVIGVVYKFRSDRGAVHISPVHTANHMDSVLILHAGKWAFGELLRLAISQDPQTVGEIIEQLVQLEHSLIHEIDGKPLVLMKRISAPYEILVLLHHSTSNRLSRDQLREFCSNKSPNVATAITRLINDKDIRPVEDGTLVITPKGQKRVIEEIMPKLNFKK